jgi:soluble lytic murein transglycosylase
MNPMRRLSSLLVTASLAMATLSLLPASPAAALDPQARNWYSARLADNARERYAPQVLDPSMPAQADPLLDAIILWDRLRRDGYDAPLVDYANFLRAHPDWPGQMAIRRRAEKSIDANDPAPTVVAYFTAFPPLSALGKLRLAQAYAATGRTADANLIARDAWDSSGLDANSENELLARFGPVVTADDNLSRFDRLMWAGQITAASRLLPKLPADQQALAQARLALRQSSIASANGLLAAVPAVQQSDPGLIYDHVMALKRTDVDAARALMAASNVAPGSVTDAEAWLKLRIELGRGALRDGESEVAYRLFANHHAFAMGRGLNERSLTERQAFIDAEWLAGWTALRKLDRASAATNHFQNVRAAALTPVSQARGDYWSGRGAEAAGKKEEAQKFYTAAAEHPDYFYGQLATERLGKTLALPRPAPISVSSAARDAFQRDELTRATIALGELDARSLQTIFMRALVEHADTPEEARLVADLAGPLGRPELGVLMGKAARAEGELGMIDIAFPRLALPPELSPGWTMIHAITRQESQFDRAVVSGAGARGLMQLMPATAQETAIKAGLPFNASRLLDDPVYNVTLGSAYYDRIRDGFAGSNVLAVAAYNAGPGNARKFVTANGDPRDPSVDVVDWIELITLSETRTYVQRVLENAVVYDMLNPSASRMPTTNRLSAYLGKKTPG